MARYDVYLADGNTYLLDIQTDLIDHLRTRVVVPLLPVGTTPPPVRKLNPTFNVGGRNLVMATHLIATLPVSELGESRFNLSKDHDEIVAALDMLFQGF